MSNYSENKAEIERFRKQLRAELDDITKVDQKILRRAVNEGVAHIKEITPVGKSRPGHVGGTLRESWRATRAKKTGNGIEKGLENNVYYAPYVNYGHRVVNRAKETRGWVEGKFMLEQTEKFVWKRLSELFRKEINRIRRKYD